MEVHHSEPQAVLLTSSTRYLRKPQMELSLKGPTDTPRMVSTRIPQMSAAW